MAGRLTGKTAVVLGASAEGGSGWCVSQALAAEGAHVFVAARSQAGIEKLAAEIGGTAIQCDAGKDEDVENLARTAAARTGGIDVAVCPAGKVFPGDIASTRRSDIEKALEINYIGPFSFIRSVTPFMPSGSAITLFSSLSSTHLAPGCVAYACAKGALNTLIRYAAIEFAPKGIRVNGILAGQIDTPLAADFLKVAGECVAKEVPLKKFVQPGELAKMVLFLTLDAVSITGENIFVDNGNHLRRPIFPDEIPPESWAVFAE